MQIRTSKLARKHFYSLLHPVDSNAHLGRDVVILSPLAGRQDPLEFQDNLSKALLKTLLAYTILQSLTSSNPAPFTQGSLFTFYKDFLKAKSLP